MKVRLTRKYADCIDGVDLRGHVPGDLVDLPAGQAQLVVAEEWGIPERREREERSAPRRRVGDYPEAEL